MFEKNNEGSVLPKTLNMHKKFSRRIWNFPPFFGDSLSLKFEDFCCAQPALWCPKSPSFYCTLLMGYTDCGLQSEVQSLAEEVEKQPTLLEDPEQVMPGG